MTQSRRMFCILWMQEGTACGRAQTDINAPEGTHLAISVVEVPTP
jgi:hypothetical protein